MSSAGWQPTQPSRDRFVAGSDLSVHNAADLSAIADRLNNRPRKILGWHPPAHLFSRAMAS